MKESEENRLIAEMWHFFRGSNRYEGDWIEKARDLKKFVEAIGSPAKAAPKLPIGAPMINSILRLLTLPEDVQAEISARRIGQDVGRRLATLRDPERIREVAKIINGMPSDDARQVVVFAKRFPGRDLETFKTRVSSSKGKKEDMNFLILAVPAEVLKFMRSESSRAGLSIQQWLLRRATEGMIRTEPQKQ
jgi:hypothetical protein